MSLGMGRQNQPELVEVTLGAEKKYLTTDLPLIDVEGFNDWGGWGYDGFIPGEVTKTAPSGDETT